LDPETVERVEAEQRLRTYFTRLSFDPTYDYEGKEEDIALIRRKRRERDAKRGLLRGRGISYDLMLRD
jgi:hypothetical protein